MKDIVNQMTTINQPNNANGGNDGAPANNAPQGGQAQDQGGQAAGANPNPAADGSASPRLFEYNGEKIEVPENFWDKEKNQPNIGAILKSQTDLRGELAKISKSPENYEVTVPDEAKDLFSPEDPVMKSLLDWGKEVGFIGNEQMNKLVGKVVEVYKTTEQQQAQAYEAEKVKAATELQKSLGADWQSKLTSMDNFFLDLVKDDPEAAQEYALARTDLAGTRFVLKVFQKFGKEAPIPGTGDQPSGNLDEQAIRQLMADKDYYSSPEKQKKVAAYYQKQYQS